LNLDAGQAFRCHVNGTTQIVGRLLGSRQPMNLGNLFYWAVVFLVIAIVAALFGFGGVAGTAMEGAKILFWVALVLFVISLVFGFMRRGP
jgi:uncharacterized membrane protein YtjA (UPF0391 family)